MSDVSVYWEAPSKTPKGRRILASLALDNIFWVKCVCAAKTVCIKAHPHTCRDQVQREWDATDEALLSPFSPIPLMWKWSYRGKVHRVTALPRCTKRLVLTLARLPSVRTCTFTSLYNRKPAAAPAKPPHSTKMGFSWPPPLNPGGTILDFIFQFCPLPSSFLHTIRTATTSYHLYSLAIYFI